MRNDNWGWQARIGLFIVASEAVPEAEWWAMAPPHVSIHAARIAAASPWARLEDGKVMLSGDLARSADHFRSMRLDSVVLAHTTSSVAGGPGWDAAVIDALAEAIGPGPYITTNGLDQQAALEAMGIKRPFVVFPPWFGEEQAKAGLAYFAGEGRTPAGFLRHDPGPGWRDMPPGNLYVEGLGFEQQIEPLYAEIARTCPADADGVLIAGTGFRCVGIIEALERDLGRPVVAANQASLWNALRLSGVAATVTGYGRLLGAS
jgi:maleate isomerase